MAESDGAALNAAQVREGIPVWEDCTASYQVSASIARGGGIWPSMISMDATDLSGTIAAHDARDLAEWLIRAAELCEESTGDIFGE